jgi:hypothetical protein
VADLLEVAFDLQNKARSRGLEIKLLGGLAIRASCPVWSDVAPLLGRQRSEDIDFIAASKQKRALQDMFVGEGYKLDESVRYSQEYDLKRFILSAVDKPKIDVFFDEIEMAHTLDLSSRISGTSSTVSIIDLFLSKVQIHEITHNDLVDLTVLLLDNDPLSSGDDRTYFSRMMSSDWGFHYTVQRNVEAIATTIEVADLTVDQRRVVSDRLALLSEAMDEAPRTIGWKLRSRIGTRMQWYQDVSEA